MIYSLTGKITMIDENTVVVDTGSVAFEVICSSGTAFALSSKSEEQTILTYLQVREDAMCLYGFRDRKEKLLFDDLLLVSGVGPKMAISILSGLSVDEIVRAIINSDVKSLSGIKGLGKKTAERIVLELSGKLGSESSLEKLILPNAESNLSSGGVKEIDEAVQVLVSTGLSKNDAMKLAKENFTAGMTSEELVLKCFKNLS